MDQRAAPLLWREIASKLTTPLGLDQCANFLHLGAQLADFVEQIALDLALFLLDKHRRQRSGHQRQNRQAEQHHQYGKHASSRIKTQTASE